MTKRLIFLFILGFFLSGCVANLDNAYSVSGSVKIADSGAGLEGVTLYLGPFGTARTDMKGNWKKDGLVGTVSVVPMTKAEFEFTPASIKVTGIGDKVDFAARPKQYSIEIECSGSGSVTKNIDQDRFATGTTIQLIAVPDKGSIFLYWQGDLSGDENPKQIALDSNKSVKAIFCSSIQEAIDLARPGGTIVVPPGTYREHLDFKGKDITVRSVDPEDPNVVAATIIDGGKSGSVVTFNSREPTSTTLAGFTITNGSGTRLGYLYGGGVCISNASPTISFNRIVGNHADHGAGIYVSGTSQPSILNNVIEKNRASVGGGGIDSTTSSAIVVIADNVIRMNSADVTAGGVETTGLTELRNNQIVNNYGGNSGGIAVFTSGSATIENNLIKGNHGNVGGIYVWEAQAKISGNTIEENFGERGGVCVVKNSFVTLEENIIANNQKSGLRLVYGTVCLQGNVFRNNYNGGIYVEGGRLQKLNGDAIVSPDEANTYFDNMPKDIIFE